MKININPKKELFKWGPIDGRPVYIDPFVQGFRKYKDEKKTFSWPDAIHYFKNDRFVVILDDDELRNRGEKLFRREVLKEKKLKASYEKWFEITKEINYFEKVVNSGLSEISDRKLFELFSDFNKTNLNFWVDGFLPELSNWGGEKILREEVMEKYPDNSIEILEKLGAPKDSSFFQKEEVEFLQLKFIKNKKEFDKKLENHQKKYYWLRNSYCFTEVLEKDYFKEELSKINIKIANKKIAEIKNHGRNVTKEKNKLIRKYKISREIIEIAEKLTHCIVWQDFRKKFIFISNHIITKMLQEISQRKKISFKELCYYCPNEIKELLTKDKKIAATERYAGFFIYYNEKKNLIWYSSGKKAVDLVKPFIEIKIDKRIKEFKGLVVSRGKNEIIKGKVKILYTPRNLTKMKEGDILVASMTSPDFITAMRKASAILTDEGGMTCHAAIVSRELKIPCLVSTKIATKILKDGDLVEVDANKGVVRILK